MKQVRKSTVSGMFYNARKATLYEQVKSCFTSDPRKDLSPQENSSERSLAAVIVPHAGIQFSGAIAAYAYHEILNHGFADVFIILGPNHHGSGSGIAMSSGGFWETPLGEIPVDKTCVKHLLDSIIDPDDGTMSNQENSIEVQLPFLQYISKDKPFSIVPIAILMQDVDTIYEIGKILGNLIKQDKRKIVLIASTDFSHEGLAYGRMIPSNTNIKTYVSNKDSLAIDKITSLNADELIETVHLNNISMCGVGPVATILVAAKILGISSVELLKYATSYDVHPDPNACVGYASFALYK